MVWWISGCTGAVVAPLETEMVAGYAGTRFVAFGDAGTGDHRQEALVASIAATCAERGCDFGLVLGDVIYPSGPDSADDPLFLSHVDAMADALDFPLHVVLGNHDYGGVRGAGTEWDKAAFYVEHAQSRPDWVLPRIAYPFRAGGVTFLGLDTNRIVHGVAEDQQTLVRTVLQQQSGPVVVFGHHPYRSVGKHGDAGAYNGLGKVSWLPGFNKASGKHWQAFFEEELCDRADVYLSAHDHNFQWWPAVCGVELVVSGGGAKPRPFQSDPAVLVTSSDEPGFFWGEWHEGLRGEFVRVVP